LDSLEKALANGEDTKQLRDFVNALDFPHVHADQPLHLALERMGAAKLDVLPVVSRANIHRLIGVVVLTDVLNSYGVERTNFPSPVA
jgi:CBS domain-containing protein